MKKRTIALLLALVLVLGAAIGGTIAWLTSATQTIENTFTVGDVAITLTETWNTDSDDADTIADSWSAKMIPGTTYTKDPVVAVTSDTNVDCYLLVKFEETDNPDTYLNYTSTLTTANGWTKGDGTDIPSNVWYREVKTTDTVKSWHLLEGDEVTVDATAVTKSNMTDAAKAKLTYTAYAVQKDNVATAAAAWDLVG